MQRLLDLSWQTQRVDGGTIFPAAGGSVDAKAPLQVPSATLAVEHYNRIVRLLARNVPVRIELNIQTTFYPETSQPNGINTMAEIPGTDRHSAVSSSIRRVRSSSEISVEVQSCAAGDVAAHTIPTASTHPLAALIDWLSLIDFTRSLLDTSSSGPLGCQCPLGIRVL